MKRILRLLIRLYPAWWRSRYGGELEALLEDSGSGSRDVWDVFRGAMAMQMKTWSFGRIVTVCGIVGLLLAGVVAFSIPRPYQSTAVLKIPDGDRPASVVADMVHAAAMPALTRNSLMGIIASQNLYSQERKRMPMEDVVDKVMRRDIHVELVQLGKRNTKITGVLVHFAYPDPSKTQQVTQTLVERFSGFEVLDPPSGPQPIIKPRSTLTGLGLIAGLLFGVVLALIRLLVALIFRRGAEPAN